MSPALITAEVPTWNAPLRAAATDLRLAVHNELRSITESSPAADFSAVQAQAKERLGATTEVWERRWRIQLSQLARNSAAELTARARRPGAAALDTYLDSVLSALPDTDSGTRQPLARNIANQASLWTPQVALQLFRHHTGMTTVQAQIELDHLKHQQNADLGSYFGADYPTSDQVTDMQHHLHEVEIAQVVPLLVQLGILIWATTSEKQLASQERQRREQLRTKIETAAREISDQILGDGWNSSIDMFREQLRAQLPPDGLLASMQDHLNQLADASRALSDLLKKT